MLTHDTELGFGLGLRTEHYADIFDGKPVVDWFEAITENYLVAGGRPLHNLMRVRERFPVALYTGRKPTIRTHEMICFYFCGMASEEELLAHIAKLKAQDEARQKI